MGSGLGLAECDPLIRARNYAQMRNFIFLAYFATDSLRLIPAAPTLK